MNIRLLSLACLLLVLSCQVRAADQAASSAPGEHAVSSTEFLAEIDNSLALAQNGGYGNLKHGAMAKMQAARDRIAERLNGHANPQELPPEQRLAVYNDQELIVATLRSNDKNRKVCRRVETLGTRIPQTECMTVAEREARARASRNATGDQQRLTCAPGGEGGSMCSK